MPTSAAKKHRTGVFFFRGPSVTAFQGLSNVGKVAFLDPLTIHDPLTENVKSFPNLFLSLDANQEPVVLSREFLLALLTVDINHNVVLVAYLKKGIE